MTNKKIININMVSTQGAIVPGIIPGTVSGNANIDTDIDMITGKIDIDMITPDTETLILALASVAAVLRGHRGIPAPLACAGGHSPSRFIRWGAGLLCCACGTRPLPADQLHRLLVRALRTRLQIVEGKAA